MAAIYKWSVKIHGATALPTVTAGIVTVADLAALDGYASKEVDITEIFDDETRVGEPVKIYGGLTRGVIVEQKTYDIPLREFYFDETKPQTYTDLSELKAVLRKPYKFFEVITYPRTIHTAGTAIYVHSEPLEIERNNAAGYRKTALKLTKQTYEA